MEGNVLFGAYNKAIVEDIKSKAPKSKNITISTLHTVGIVACYKITPSLKVDSYKCSNILEI